MEDVIKHMDNLHRGYKISAKLTGAVQHDFDALHKNVTLQMKKNQVKSQHISLSGIKTISYASTTN